MPFKAKFSMRIDFSLPIIIEIIHILSEGIMIPPLKLIQFRRKIEYYSLRWLQIISRVTYTPSKKPYRMINKNMYKNKNNLHQGKEI